MNKILLAAGVAGLALAAAQTASAQSIDYGSLQALFNEPVTTSATGSPQRSTRVPVDMDIISAEDIERSGAVDLPTILSRVAGVDVLAWSADTADVGVRGYNQAMSARLLVLINGRQSYLDHYGFTNWATLPVRLEEIRQIEVVKGPNAALFGFNAVGGVVNIITYNPKFDDTDFITVRGGTEDYAEASVGQTVKLGEQFSARVTGGYSRQDQWRNSVGVADRLIPNPERATLNVDTVTQLADKVELRVEGGWTHNRQAGFISTYSYGPSKYLTESLKAALTWESKAGLIQATAYQNNLTAKSEIASIDTRWENKIQVFNVQDLFKVGANHTFRVAGEYRRNETPTTPGHTAKIKYDVLSASGMWNWQVTEKFALTTAIRHDKLSLEREGDLAPGLPNQNAALWDRTIKETTYNVGAVFTPTDADTFRATYARGVQLPTLVDLGALQLVIPAAPGVNIAYVGNPGLEPTVVTNFGVGYDRDLPQIRGQAGIRFFVQKSEDIKGQPNSAQLDVMPTATSLPGFSYRNIGDSKLKGVEVLASGKYANGMHWNANYTYTDVEDDTLAAFDAATRYAAYELSTPKHRANLNVGWTNETWTVDGFVRYEGSKDLYYAAAVRPVDSFVSLAGRVAREFDGGVTVAVSGQNLLSERQQQTSGLKAERRLFLSVAKAW